MKKILLNLLVFPAMVGSVVAWENDGNPNATLSESGLSYDSIYDNSFTANLGESNVLSENALAKTEKFDLGHSANLPTNAFHKDNTLLNNDKLNLAKSANLSELYFEHWDRNYERNNIIDNLGLDEDEYSESIDNIRQLGWSAISHSLNSNDDDLNVDVIGGLFNDILITTGKGADETIVDYLDRMTVSNYNYIFLENLLYMLADKNDKHTTDELLDTICLKIIQRTYTTTEETIQSIITRVEKSKCDVAKYVAAGKIDQFLLGLLSNTQINPNKRDTTLDLSSDISISQPNQLYSQYNPLNESLASKMLEKRNTELRDEDQNRNSLVHEYELEEKVTAGDEAENSFERLDEDDWN